MLISTFFASLVTLDAVTALRIPVRSYSTRASFARHEKRSGSIVQVVDVGNAQYVADISVGGTKLSVMLDTGSSDLWVTGNIPTTNDLGRTVSVTYAVGQATGEVNSAAVSFGGFDVPDQNYMLVPQSASGDFQGIDGILGLGPSSGSRIRQSLGTSAADPLLDQIFRQDTSTPNFISFTLGRSGAPSSNGSGELAIGEVLPNMASINDQPKISVTALPIGQTGDQHWTGLVDGFIGPDGQDIPIESLVSSTPSGKILAVLDSGFTLPQVPRNVSDAIYGRVPGASFDSNNHVWTVPCDQEINLTVVIAGQKYPVHPLDVSASGLNLTDASGKVIPCVGSYQPITNESFDGTFDAILGMGFLRNTYTLINFGDFVNGNPSKQGDPFFQMLSVTDPATAHQDFVTARLNGVDTTGDASHALLPANESQHSPDTDLHPTNTNNVQDFISKYWPYIAAGGGGLVLLIVGSILIQCCCSRRRRPAVAGVYQTGPYRQLDDPRSAPITDYPMVPQAPYTDPYMRR